MAFSGTMTHTKNSRQEADLKRLEELEASQTAAPTIVEEVKKEEQTGIVNKDEETWKKRYGDLRSYQAKTENDLKTQINQLQTQLNKLSNEKVVSYPKTPAEVSLWAEKYPDLNGVFETIAMQKSEAIIKSLEEKIAGLENKNAQSDRNAERQRAWVKLLEFHPDFGQIAQTEDFKEWLDDQPANIRDAIKVNETDPFSAARTVDLYKLEKGVGKKEKKQDTRDNTAALAVKPSSPIAPAPVPLDTNVWSESRLEAVMKTARRQDHNKIMAEVDEAMSKGKFVYDLSGAQ